MTDSDLNEAELRDLPKPRRRPPQPVVKGRQCVLSRRDIAAFLNIVRERFPTVVFLTGEVVGEGYTKWERVPDPVGARENIHPVVPDGDWDAEARRKEEEENGFGPDNPYSV